MLWLGDIVVPRGKEIECLDMPLIFNQGAIANLEGAIVDEVSSVGEYSLYNDKSVLEILDKFNVKVVSLANNHILDESDSFSNTIVKLENNNIAFVGAGYSLEDAYSIKKVQIDGDDYFILACAWSITGVQNKRGKIAKVATINKKQMINKLTCFLKETPNAKIICWLHWGYELEMFPLPMDREFAHELIDLGVWAVVGCHSHCLQGMEIYNNHLIVYGLGNFYCPEGVFLNGKLNYPEIAHKEVAIEIKNDEIFCHWFRYEKDVNKLRYLGRTTVDCEEVKKITPYNDMSNKDYRRWFKENRRKKKLLPVFYSYDARGEYLFKWLWTKTRGWIIRKMFVLGIKGGPI